MDWEEVAFYCLGLEGIPGVLYLLYKNPAAALAGLGALGMLLPSRGTGGTARGRIGKGRK